MANPSSSALCSDVHLIDHAQRLQFHYGHKRVSRFDSCEATCCMLDSDSATVSDQTCACITFVRCPLCKHKSTFGTFIDLEEDMLSFECPRCLLVFCVCQTCYPLAQMRDGDSVGFMRLLRHPNTENVTTEKDGAFSVENDEEFDEEYEIDTAIVYKQPVYYFSESKFGMVTGPCGGYASEWYCDKCKQTTFLQDK